MKQIRKEYDRPFLLEPTKLTRLMNSRVFLWGDETERYTNLLQRRNRLWTIIIGVTLIGVGAKFFSTSLDSLLPP